MLINNSEKQDQYLKSGVWGNEALDHLLAKNAKLFPDQIALCDAPDREDWHDGAPQSLTFGELEEKVDALARFLHSVNLKRDTIVGLRLSNTVEAIITLLAVWRAGLIACPLPLVWRNDDMLRWLERLGVRALIGSTGLKDDTGEMLRDVAVDMFGVRFVFGLGGHIPEGLVDLAPYLAGPASSIGDDKDTERENPANHVATITWSMGAAGSPCPVPRTHNHWLAAAHMHNATAQIANRASLFCPYYLTGIAGLGVVASWLQKAGTLHMHRFSSLQMLRSHIDFVNPDHVILPGALYRYLEPSLSNRSASLIWQVTQGEQSQFENNDTLTHLTVIDELAMTAARSTERKGFSVNRLPTGKIVRAVGADTHETLLEVAIHGPRGIEIQGSQSSVQGGELLVRGPMVPEASWPESGKDALAKKIWKQKHGYANTGIGCRYVDAAKTALAPLGWLGDIINVGGIATHAHEIDALYQTYDLARDAAVFVMHDELVQKKLCAAIVPKPGMPFDREDFINFLSRTNAARHLIPWTAIAVNEIPRGTGDIILRAKLLEFAEVS